MNLLLVLISIFHIFAFGVGNQQSVPEHSLGAEVRFWLNSSPPSTFLPESAKSKVLEALKKLVPSGFQNRIRILSIGPEEKLDFQVKLFDCQTGSACVNHNQTQKDLSDLLRNSDNKDLLTYDTVNYTVRSVYATKFETLPTELDTLCLEKKPFCALPNAHCKLKYTQKQQRCYCNEGFLSINNSCYQNLKNANETACKSCIANSGQCYGELNTKKGCLCDGFSGGADCEIKFLKVNCTTGFLHLCFTPFNASKDIRYKDLASKMWTGDPYQPPSAFVYIEGKQNTFGCGFTYRPNGIEFCGSNPKIWTASLAWESANSKQSCLKKFEEGDYTKNEANVVLKEKISDGSDNYVTVQATCGYNTLVQSSSVNNHPNFTVKSYDEEARARLSDDSTVEIFLEGTNQVNYTWNYPLLVGENEFFVNILHNKNKRKANHFDSLFVERCQFFWYNETNKPIINWINYTCTVIPLDWPIETNVPLPSRIMPVDDYAYLRSENPVKAFQRSFPGIDVYKPQNIILKCRIRACKKETTTPKKNYCDYVRACPVSLGQSISVPNVPVDAYQTVDVEYHVKVATREPPDYDEIKDDSQFAKFERSIESMGGYPVFGLMVGGILILVGVLMLLAYRLGTKVNANRKTIVPIENTTTASPVESGPAIIELHDAIIE